MSARPVVILLFIIILLCNILIIIIIIIIIIITHILPAIFILCFGVILFRYLKCGSCEHLHHKHTFLFT